MSYRRRQAGKGAMDKARSSLMKSTQITSRVSWHRKTVCLWVPDAQASHIVSPESVSPPAVPAVCEEVSCVSIRAGGIIFTIILRYVSLFGDYRATWRAGVSMMCYKCNGISRTQLQATLACFFWIENQSTMQKKETKIKVEVAFDNFRVQNRGSMFLISTCQQTSSFW